MTPQELRQLKKKVSKRLAEVDVWRYHLDSVDGRIHDYVVDVCNQPHRHNLWEQLGVERFLQMCRKYGLNVREVRTFFAFYESLKFPGTNGHRTYRLTPVQAFQFASIYGFWSEGRRVTRTAVLYVPRKFSKTTSTAAAVLYDLLYGDNNGEAYVGANSQDQAKKCFDVVRGALFRLDPKGKYYTVNEQVVKSRRSDRSAIAQCLTANARTKDGLNASLVVMDEYAQSRDSRLLDVLTTSMGVRKNPLTIIITTASDVIDGPFHNMLEGCKRVLSGEAENDALFAHVFEPDVDDAEGSESTWLKVHPHLGVTVNMEFYRQSWAEAQVNGAEAMMAFRTKLLNIFTSGQHDTWIESDVARGIMRPFRIEDLHGFPRATIAIDLSVRGDLSAVSTCIYQPKTQSFIINTDYFFPRGALQGHPQEALFRAWAEAGHLHLLDGEYMDYPKIAEYILSRPKYVRLHAIGYDAYKAKEMTNIIANSGLRSLLKPVSQTYSNFTSVCMSFELAVRSGKLIMNDNPINAYCIENAVMDTDRLGNMKPTKRHPSRKIDGLITALMSLKLFHEMKVKK